MLAQAASRIGLNCHVYAPDADSCAFDVVQARNARELTRIRTGSPHSRRTCDVITYEFENVPSQTANFLCRSASRCCRIRGCSRLTQDRLIEKEFVDKLGIATAPYAAGRRCRRSCSRRRTKSACRRS